MDEVLFRLSRLFQTLGNGIRLQLLQQLQEGEHSVSDLANSIDRPVTNVSHHLVKLRDNDLVASETRGRHRMYRLKRPKLVGACFALTRFLERD